MKRNYTLYCLAVVMASVLVAISPACNKSTQSQDDLYATATEGPMPIHIYASGELQAKKSEKIQGPDALRSVGIYQVTIENLVPEGTVVKQGEFIASLDRTELDSKIKESQTEIDKITTQLDQAKIDTAIEMRSLRDQLINLKYAMEEKKLTLELSKYEPQAIRQQAELDLQKAEREYDQLENKLVLTRDKSIAKIEEINASYRQQEFKLNRLLQFQQEMTITAPKPGMVIYVRNWNGKRGPGSQISAWDPVVAELPDLSEMITKAYINEVDISKVLPGQTAKITVDAFPGKEFTGMVMTKANIGEQVRNFDTKVFEVIVLVNEQDSLLRPAMTTGISILVDSIPKCVQVPLEAVFTDSLSFVYKKDRGGTVKQEVVTGQSNDINIAVALGLEAGDVVLLNAPANADELEFAYLNEDEKSNSRKEMDTLLADRMKIQQEKAQQVKATDITAEDSGGEMIIIY